MRSKPTWSQNYEWETGKPAGFIRDTISKFQTHPTFMTLVFTAAVGATFVTYETVSTAIDPYHPSYTGMRVLSKVFTHSKYKGLAPQDRPWLYDEYLRNRYEADPDLAFRDLEKLYGIKHTGDIKQTTMDFTQKWEASPLHPENYEGGASMAVAMSMFLSSRAYGQEIYKLPDMQRMKMIEKMSHDR